MKTRYTLSFTITPSRDKFTIPAGTSLRRAHNLPAGPDGKPQYWTPARLLPLSIRAQGCPITWTEAMLGQ